MAAGRPRLSERPTRRPWRTPRRELDERGLYPQHARRLARLYEQRPRRFGARGLVTGTIVAMAKKRKPRPGAARPSQRRVTPLRSRATRAATALDLHRCEQFLLHEARLLDEGKFDDWLALFTADGWYWVPSEPEQDNPHDTV